MNFSDNRFQFSIGEHRDNNVIWVSFEKNSELIAYLKSQTKAKWSANHQKWYVADCRHYRELFGLVQAITGKTVISKIHLVNLPEFQRFQEHLKLKGYSPNTLRTYSLEFAQLLYVLKSFPVQELSAERLRSYFPRYSGC